MSPTINNHNCIGLELFNTFYGGYIEYKHYVKYIIQKISSNKEIGASFENEIES